MQQVASDSIGQLLGVVFYGLVASALTILGALAEIASMENLLAGQNVLGLWEVAFGAVLLYAGFTVGTEVLLPRIDEMRSGA